MSIHHPLLMHGFTGNGGRCYEEIQTMLLRMRELAVQSSNGTNTTADRRTSIGSRRLNFEISRIADNTTWAGLQLLDGSLSAGITFQVGPDSGQTITHSIAS